MPEATANLSLPAYLGLVSWSASTSLVTDSVGETHILPQDQVLPWRKRHYYYGSFVIREAKYEGRRPTLNYQHQRSAGFPPLPGSVIGDWNYVCLWPPTLDLLLTLLWWQSRGSGWEAKC